MSYDYLLSMPLWNLTQEKVDELCAEKVVKSGEVKGLHGRGLHSFPFPLNLSLLCPNPLNLSLLCPPSDPHEPVLVSRRCSS